jgi:hypothetical protein
MNRTAVPETAIHKDGHAAQLRARRIRSTVFWLLPGTSSCSQIRNTLQPCLRRAFATRKSRARFVLTLVLQNELRVLGAL